MSQVAERAASTSTGGVLRPSGVASLRQRLASRESAAAFDEWARGPYSVMVRKALRDLALNGFNQDPSDTSVAYGMTLGLQLAAQLMEDPSAVYPDVFLSSEQTVGKLPEVSFEMSPDSLMDE